MSPHESSVDTTVQRWFLSAAERGNRHTRIDDRHPDGLAHSEGNVVRAIVHGAPYFAELAERIGATGSGDLVYFVDWWSNPDEQLTEDETVTVSSVLSAAAERGVRVRGLLWRSHWGIIGFNARTHRLMGEQINESGGLCLRDMRVRTAGAHHQKLLVIRHAARPLDDIAYVGGIDLCHSRRDDAGHGGDPQVLPMASAYGATPAWHDVQLAVQGPAVFDLETVFRERWDDTTPLTLHPGRRLSSLLTREPLQPAPLEPQDPPPPVPPHEGDGASTLSAVQVLRTYPDIDPVGYDFAPEGERSIQAGLAKALKQARSLVYVEDQYLWSSEVGELFATALSDRPDLRMVFVLPMVPDEDNPLAMPPQLWARRLALEPILAAGGDRVAAFWLVNSAGLPIYVHSKVVLIDDTWASVGSDNLNRRSWAVDSEVSCAVLGPLARALRRELLAEHLGVELDQVPDEPERVVDAMRTAAEDLDEWFATGDDQVAGRSRRAVRAVRHAHRLWGRRATSRRAHRRTTLASQSGERPAGRLRTLPIPELTAAQQLWVPRLYDTFVDPDAAPEG